jgi:N-hydroxyarylamine O-acetyltransferase
VASAFRLDHYLARIGLTGPVKPDLATLTALHAAHVRAIPFETLDPFLGRPVKIDAESLQAKLVGSRRGGYCFEQNGLFKAALDAIGFAVTGYGGRVRWGMPPEKPLGGRTHGLLKVDLPEGPYLADVGFGSCVLDVPLRFETGLEQTTDLGTYRLSEVNGLLALDVKRGAGWKTKFVFDRVPQLPADYELGNWYSSAHPASLFVTTLLMERLEGGVRHRLVDRRLVTEARDGDVMEERKLDSAEALGRVLDEVFHVTPPVPVKEIFRRLSD